MRIKSIYRILFIYVKTLKEKNKYGDSSNFELLYYIIHFNLIINLNLNYNIYIYIYIYIFFYFFFFFFLVHLNVTKLKSLHI